MYFNENVIVVESRNEVNLHPRVVGGLWIATDTF